MTDVKLGARTIEENVNLASKHSKNGTVLVLSTPNIRNKMK